MTTETESPTPELTEDDLNAGRYEVIGGHYFTEEKRYVPLANRPARATQEKALQGHPTVVDVTICGFSTFVYVTDKSQMEEISAILADEVSETLHKTIDDNSYRDSEYALIYR